MPLLMRKLALLAKLEVTYGTDPVPTGGANAMLVRNASVTPIEMVTESRELYRPYLGNSEDVIGAFFGRMRFDVEAAGAGAAGTVPKYGALLRACMMAETVVAGAGVTYTPVSTAIDSLTMYFHLDGVLHKFIGARGNVSFRGSNRAATMFGFEFMGLFVPVTDAALPTADYSGFIAPLAFNKANTPTFTIHGVTGAVLRNFSWNMNNQVVYRNLVNSEMVRITDRKPTGSIEMGAELMAVKNWFSTVRDAATGAVQLIHGTVAGNIVEFNMPAMQLNSLSYSEFEGDAMLSASTKLMPTGSGNNELNIVVR